MMTVQSNPIKCSCISYNTAPGWECIVLPRSPLDWDSLLLTGIRWQTWWLWSTKLWWSALSWGGNHSDIKHKMQRNLSKYVWYAACLAQVQWWCQQTQTDRCHSLTKYCHYDIWWCLRDLYILSDIVDHDNQADTDCDVADGG